MIRNLSGFGKVAIGCSLAAAIAFSAPASAQTPPPQPGAGQLGGSGPCTQGTRREGFGSQGNYNWLYVPAGSGAPRTGGQCNDAQRPVIFIAPGYVLFPIIPEAYADLINNMVSNGYIVAFANTGAADGGTGYNQMISGFDYAATTLNAQAGNRMNLAHVGIWGHSYGAGAIPWLSQRFATRGWGSSSLWLAVNASSFVYNQGASGPITIPANARLQVVAYDDDDTVDQDAAIDVFKSVTTPASQKTFVHLKSDGTYKAIHQLPTRNGSSANFLNYYGVFRNYQALGDCARSGTNCAANLTFMGTFSDGRPATPAVVQANPTNTANNPPTVVVCNANSSSGQAARQCNQ